MTHFSVETGALKPVYVQAEPFRTLRELVCYETRLTGLLTVRRVQIKALCRRPGVAYRGKALYAKRRRSQATSPAGGRPHQPTPVPQARPVRDPRSSLRRRVLPRAGEEILPAFLLHGGTGTAERMFFVSWWIPWVLC